jgi:ketosteroid isomerase-like protein
MVAPDRAKLGELVADELSYGHSGGKVDTKTSFIDDLVAGAAPFLSINLADQTVRVVGDVAIVRHTFTGQMQEKGKDPNTVNLKVLQVWKKHGGHWKLLARQAVRVQP